MSVSRFLENLDRAIARIRRVLIKKLLVGGGISHSLLRGEHPSNTEFRIIELTSKESHLVHQTDNSKVTMSHSFDSRFLISLRKVSADTRTSVIYSDVGNLIPESSSWSKEQLLLNSLPVPMFSKVRNIDENAFENIILPSNGFYHWLIEDLPAVIKALQLLNSPRLIVYENAPKYVNDVLREFNIPVLKVPRFIKIEQLYLISRGNDTGWPKIEDIELLRNFFSGYKSNLVPQAKKVFIPRAGFSRNEKFEAELCEKLKQIGWMIYRPENHELQQQINFLSDVTQLAGFHGAGLSGMIWNPNLSKIIELMPSRNVPCYRRMAEIFNLPYSVIHYDPIKVKYELNSNLIVEEIVSELDKC